MKKLKKRLQKLERIIVLCTSEEDEFPDRTLTCATDLFTHLSKQLYSSLTRTKRARLSRTAAETLSVLREKAAKWRQSASS
jgi:hypothetical protein